MSQVRVLTHEQRNMLKTFIPAYVLIKSGSAEELETFWESVYAQWFQRWPEHEDAATRDCHCRVSFFLYFIQRFHVSHIAENSFVHTNELLAQDLV